MNTHYFHLTTLIHKRYNAINTLFSPNSRWITERDHIGSAFEEYYTSRFTSSAPILSSFMLDLIVSSVTPEMNQRLEVVPLGIEVRQVVFQMEKYKSPGPNSMTTIFYKQYWGIVGPKVIEEVQKVFDQEE